MNRKGSQLPWGASGRPSLYGGPRRGSGMRRYAVLGAIVLGVIVVAWFLVGRSCGEHCRNAWRVSARRVSSRWSITELQWVRVAGT